MATVPHISSCCRAVNRAVLSVVLFSPLLLPLLLSLFVSGCNYQDDRVDSWQAQKRVTAAYFARLKQCDQEPGLLILVPDEVREGQVRQCEADLLAADCPLEEPPPFCRLLLFL